MAKLCNCTGLCAQKGPTLDYFSAVIILKLSKIFNKGSHVFILHWIPQIITPVLIQIQNLTKFHEKNLRYYVIFYKIIFSVPFFNVVPAHYINNPLMGCKISFKILSWVKSILKDCLFYSWWREGCADYFKNLYSFSSTKDSREFTASSEGS